MSPSPAQEAINRVLAILTRSFAQYLAFAPPWRQPQRESQAVSLLRQMAEDQQTLAERITALLRAESLPILGAEFPMEYTDKHDLDLDFILQLATEYQRQDLADLEACAEQLRLTPRFAELADEALGLGRGHLELLNEATGQLTHV